MREAWDHRPSPFAPAPSVLTFDMTPVFDNRHVTRPGGECWCKPVTRWCDDGCCRIIQHVPHGPNG